MKYPIGILVACVTVLCSVTTVSAADQAADKAAINKAIESYTAAFNRGDAEAIASCWSEQAEYVLPDGGKVTGRKAIQLVFAKLFAENKGLELEIDQSSIRLEGPDLAVEEGVAVVSREGQIPEVTRYVARYVKEDAAWRLKSVEEIDAQAAPSHYEQLKELAWLAGEWADQDENTTVATSCRWSRNKNFLSQVFAVSSADQIDLEGLQLIGFDAAEGKIRSWVFDSDGGIGQGSWTRDGNRWTIESSHVLPDGRKGRTTRVITRIDDDTFTLKSVDREVDGEQLPDVEEVKVVRKK